VKLHTNTIYLGGELVGGEKLLMLIEDIGIVIVVAS